MINIKENINLSEYTTIRLGGKAKYFCECIDEEEIIECLNYVRENKLKFQILGGGSNIVFSDEGFDGLVLKVEMKNIFLKGVGGNNEVEVIAEAGVDWDEFVMFCAAQGFAGIECLSGIPGTVGATPIQNVGAYGQEVSQTISEVSTIELDTLNRVNLSNKDCRFGYRDSRFKSEDSKKYIITEVKFRLKRNGEPEIKYPELINYMLDYENATMNGNKNLIMNGELNPSEKLKIVRNAVLEIRKRKSMVVDENAPDSISCGSFFVNPVMSVEDFIKLENKWKDSEESVDETIPHFSSDKGIKVSAAWLMENAGFKKGYRKNGAGISSKHTLAIINCGGKTSDVIGLAYEIIDKVFDLFDVRLKIEPVIVD